MVWVGDLPHFYNVSINENLQQVSINENPNQTESLF